jgi:hypothetical protein
MDKTFVQTDFFAMNRPFFLKNRPSRFPKRAHQITAGEGVSISAPVVWLRNNTVLTVRSRGPSGSALFFLCQRDRVFGYRYAFPSFA